MSWNPTLLPFPPWFIPPSYPVIVPYPVPKLIVEVTTKAEDNPHTCSEEHPCNCCVKFERTKETARIEARPARRMIMPAPGNAPEDSRRHNRQEPSRALMGFPMIPEGSDVGSWRFHPEPAEDLRRSDGPSVHSSRFQWVPDDAESSVASSHAPSPQPVHRSSNAIRNPSVVSASTYNPNAGKRSGSIYAPSIGSSMRSAAPQFACDKCGQLFVSEGYLDVHTTRCPESRRY